MMDALWSREWFALVCLLVAAALIFRLLYRRKLKAARRWKRMGLDRPDVWVRRVATAPAPHAPAAPVTAAPKRELPRQPLANLRKQLTNVRASIQQSLSALEQLEQGCRRLSIDVNHVSGVMHERAAAPPGAASSRGLSPAA